MAQYHLQTPFDESSIRALKVGDIVTFDGTLFGIRDLTQIYMFDQKHEPPVSLRDMPCIHTAPSLKKVGDTWLPICVGTTTSTRMERFSPLLMERHGVRAIIGKGGLLGDSLEAMQKHGAVYLSIVGGAAAVETTQIVGVKAVHWEQLHPEALYEFTVKNFGPLIVSMDSHGGHKYFDIKERARNKLPRIYKNLCRAEGGGEEGTPTA